jgi:predicted house-cleaning noncanonical NTP pyrophosphatase (MazG superfamily)
VQGKSQKTRLKGWLLLLLNLDAATGFQNQTIAKKRKENKKKKGGGIPPPFRILPERD